MQYQLNWTQKNFEKMPDYVAEPFYSQQCEIFQRNFGSRILLWGEVHLRCKDLSS